MAIQYSASTSWMTGEYPSIDQPLTAQRTCFVFSIICRPYAVVLEEMAKHGSLPMVAPVKPYTEFALILSASCLPSSTARLKGSVSFFKSALARFRAAIRSSRIVGRRPLRRVEVTKKSILLDEQRVHSTSR